MSINEAIERITDLFSAPPEFAVTLADYYADRLVNERLEVYCDRRGDFVAGRIEDVAESIYLGEADTCRAYWVADDGSFSDWLLVDDVLMALGME